MNLHPQASIEWLDLETAADRNKEEKKFFFIDIYTDWCGWCKKMDQSTFKDSAVVEYMNQHFYAVKMNAESKAPIAYKEVLYESKMYNGKAYNELAVNLLSGKMSFPSFVVLSKKEVKLGTIVGYQKPTELLLALKGYVEK
jgi:thioredoxin-related protein